MSHGQLIISIIGAISPLALAAVTVITANNVVNTKLENIQKQFDRLEAKVDKHNNFMERIAVLERDDKTAFNRIDELREDVRDLQNDN